NLVGWASSPPPIFVTGKMPVPQKILWGGLLARPNLCHRQDACATKNLVGWASSPPQSLSQARCGIDLFPG
ncbi:hypothetical protein, partial [Microcoleus sp. PH2017_18_LLB_O_A]|uniref:hypothetical protein n=1 Tax=Microcoleus sp. PH2017_18_LLB_O_A TaxID=2798829 RepID=UPI0025E40C4B